MRILNSIFNVLEIELILQSGIDVTQLLNENVNDQEILEKNSSLLIEIKSSINISYIIKSLFESSKEVNFNNKRIQLISNFNNKYLEDKNCIELPPPPKEFPKNFKKFQDDLKSTYQNNFKKILVDFGLKDSFTNINLDNVKLSFYSPEINNGYSLVLKINNLTKVSDQLLK